MSFGEDACRLINGRNYDKLKCASEEMLTNKVTIILHVFRCAHETHHYEQSELHYDCHNVGE
ncbi:hypothetical protein Scep_001292 [Stephania cephalantha]|uniref:Uncharacterized protein n=1 Tax=Stephania cephalantha TaxID=152367 RepID=A0AAP0L7W6_9MAGN